MRVCVKHVPWFGAYPLSYEKMADEKALGGMVTVMENTADTQTPFSRLTEKDISNEDKEFILKMMKMDLNERPAALQLLRDEWFKGV